MSDVLHVIHDIPHVRQTLTGLLGPVKVHHCGIGHNARRTPASGMSGARRVDASHLVRQSRQE
ncbi:MAG: hypothetical protein ACFNXZ_13320, partial [Lautropia mirabilis]